MSDLSSKKISELKKHLRELRMAACPPISKMKKADVIAAIESHHADKHKANVERSEKALHGLRKVEAETSVRNAVRAEEANKTRVKKAVEHIEKVLEKPKKEKKERKTMAVSLKADVAEEKMPREVKIARAEEVKEAPKTGRAGLIKGSQEARDYMKRLREARKDKKQSVD
jgi:hypothetical protein